MNLFSLLLDKDQFEERTSASFPVDFEAMGLNATTC